ncbi:butyrophilin subfamily 3 member A2-like isoform X2 [Anoplopoma fimbria]|uniref:butyrophilin subfamily 3 member A2-like isoform X2 n=1 Tax=Anoplopoma fimbria TaxID=229290 RepID=UPI0023ED0591|nr:butyrophilin subfamily 3 member A2-like isoform X2 [Anoplopoma fimbria]
MYHLLLLLAPLLSHCSGDSLVHGPPETVLAIAGGVVILPCSFNITPSGDFPTVEWSKEGLEPNMVFLYRDGCEVPEMKDQAFWYRTSLISKELQNGNISLRISNVQLTDAGKYQCMTLWSKAPREITTVELSVGAVSEPKLSVTSEEGGGMTLQCDAVGWLPEPRIYFLDEQGNNISAEEAKRDQDTRGCYSVRRRVTLRDVTKRVICRVHQPEINQTREAEFVRQVGSCYCVLTAIIAVGTVLLLLAVCGLAVFLWKKCQKSAGEPNSPSSPSNQSPTSEIESLLPDAKAENTRNATIEKLTKEVADLKSQLREKDDTIRQLRNDNEAQLTAVVCQNDQPVFLQTPAATPNSSPPTSANFPQNRRPKPGFFRQISHPAPVNPITKAYRRHSSPGRFHLASSPGSFSTIGRSVSDPRDWPESISKLQHRHSSAFPSSTKSNSRFPLLTDVTEE